MSHINPQRSHLIAELKSVARESGSDVWIDVANRLEKPRRTHAEVNLSRIDRYARDDETVVVPGKVLGSGALTSGFTIAAVDFSASAETKIDQADGKALDLVEALKDNPEGSNVRVIQ